MRRWAEARLCQLIASCAGPGLENALFEGRDERSGTEAHTQRWIGWGPE